MSKVFSILLSVSALFALPLAAHAAETPTNSIEALQAKLDAGTVKLTFANDGHGWLQSVLAALGVAQDSQLLTFTRSSLQFDKISPKTPRAIYFGDDVAVAAVVEGHVLEILANDAKGDPAFYTLDTAKTDKPKFEREGPRCLSCHGMVNTYAPGWMVANITAIADGTPQFPDVARPFYFTEQSTPFEERWGGWYVTGTHGAMHHRGNVTAKDLSHPYELPMIEGQNVTDLSGRFDTHQTLQPGSDIVALMTLEHQNGFANRVAMLNARAAGSQAELDKAIDEIVANMTFADEVPLPSPVKGTSSFTDTFPKRGPRDAQGRSLRDFDLKTRLFRYPLSYMVYSASFDSLNPAVKTKLWRRLYDRLRATPDGAAAIAILAATKPDVPDYWKKGA
ncbi:MAG TPA: hypothetical protein VGM46_04665 [Mesorhizobium sp.]